MSTFLGGVRQVGYVVADIEKSMKIWHQTLGVGPWFYREQASLTEYHYYGKQSELPHLSIAQANSGDLQIELVQQRNDVPSLYLDTLRRNGEVAQHVAYWIDHDFDGTCSRLNGQGFVTAHAGRMGSRGGFVYMIHPSLPSGMFEISDLSGGKADSFRKIRQAAVEWDGRDPVRSFTSL